MKKTKKTKKTKKYAVDVHWDVAKCYEIEASSPEEAVQKMWDTINKGDVCVWTDGFETTDDVEVDCSGEEDETGAIMYN